MNASAQTISVWYNATTIPGRSATIIGKHDSLGSGNGYNIFTEKFYKYKENCEKNFCSNIDEFLSVLDILKEDIPSNKCDKQYNKNLVSKYDFYTLLKEIGNILITIFPYTKTSIEEKNSRVFLFVSGTPGPILRFLQPSVWSVQHEHIFCKRGRRRCCI